MRCCGGSNVRLWFPRIVFIVANKFTDTSYDVYRSFFYRCRKVLKYSWNILEEISKNQPAKNICDSSSGHTPKRSSSLLLFPFPKTKQTSINEEETLFLPPSRGHRSKGRRPTKATTNHSIIHHTTTTPSSRVPRDRRHTRQPSSPIDDTPNHA